MMDRIRLMERRDIDELIILDIDATPNNRGPRFEEVSQLCENLFCPVTVGGGVRNAQDIRRLLASGADKVSICTAVEKPGLLEEAAQKFGSQAIVAVIDVDNDGRCVYECGRRRVDLQAAALAQDIEARGAGEILLQSINRDGMMDGYDLDLIHEVSSAVDIPAVAAGGCGSYEHIAKAIEAGAHACAVGAAFQFCEMTPKGAARYLHDQGYSVRL